MTACPPAPPGDGGESSHSAAWIFSTLRVPRDRVPFRSRSFLPPGFCVTCRWALTSMGSPLLDAGRRIASLVGKADDAPRVIRAYHGSPHSFSRFDASKIGTGEGAQAYGHGLYFAQDPGVANAYRRRLTEQPGAGIVLYYDGHGERLPTDLVYRLEDDRRIHGWLPDQAPEAARRIADEMRARADQMRSGGLGGFEVSWWEQGAKQLNEFAERGLRPAGRTYEVEIGYPEQALLDHDSPFMTPAGSVAAEVLRAHNPAAISPRTLREIQSGEWRFISPSPQYGNPYQRAATELHGLARTQGGSAALADAGIPGIRYLDQGSRPSGEGTRNYVMFPGTEDRIRILRQYGLLPPLIGAGMMEEE